LASPGDGVTVAKNDAEEIVLTIGDRTYRVRGLAKNTGFEALKVSLRVACGETWHLDTLDLAQAKQRAAFVQAAGDETALKPELLKHDVGRVLLKLEELQEARLRAQVTPSAPPMAPELRAKAEAFLRDPSLWELIAEHAALCGIAGERTNVLLGYLGAVSRLLDRPLAIIVQSSSAAGKTTMMDAILAFMPPERRIKYSAMTGQSLFYMGDADLRHKILAIVEEAGAEKASYALKLLQSEGELRIASTGKNPATGRMETQEYHVQGPTMIFLTTTSHELDEELQNRCLVLTVDESREQTERIHASAKRGPRPVWPARPGAMNSSKSTGQHNPSFSRYRSSIPMRGNCASSRIASAPAGTMKSISFSSTPWRCSSSTNGSGARLPAGNASSPRLMTSPAPTPSHTKPWGGAWTTCRRRPADSWDSPSKWKRNGAAKPAPGGGAICGPSPAGAIPSLKSISGAWWNWNTSSRNAIRRTCRASLTNCSSMAR
jgi:hypothetical protein